MTVFNSHDRLPPEYFDVDGVASKETIASFVPRVSYVHEPTVGYYHYGAGHPMKPYRLALTHDLVVHYGITEYMTVLRGRHATMKELSKFHSEEYLEFLRKATSVKSTNADKNIMIKLLKAQSNLRTGMGSGTTNLDSYSMPHAISSSSELLETTMDAFSRFNLGEDCPLFEGLYDFTSLYTGCSLIATKRLISGAADIAINWSGGLHHAKRSEASGFCYINDIVLSILELLQVYPRVLYVDIDVHHGDGVQEAFYNNDRVACMSLHKYGEGFFPGTGRLEETGVGRGLGFSVNVPLESGIDDASYQYLFRPILKALVETFRPSVIVLQCGADSLAGDRLGVFNLSIEGHGACVAYAKSLGIPLLVLGGGGYTIRNVSRCWTYETSILAGVLLDNELPLSSPHIDYFGPEYLLRPTGLDNVSRANVFGTYGAGGGGGLGSGIGSLSGHSSGASGSMGGALDGSHPNLSKYSTCLNSRAYLDAVLATCLQNVRSKIKGAPSVAFETHPIDDYDPSSSSSSEDDFDDDQTDQNESDKMTSKPSFDETTASSTQRSPAKVKDPYSSLLYDGPPISVLHREISLKDQILSKSKMNQSNSFQEPSLPQNSSTGSSVSVEAQFNSANPTLASSPPTPLIPLYSPFSL